MFSHFNSIKVRLKRSLLLRVLYKFRDFNSIKVRLKPITDNFTDVFLVFQFHKGTIKTFQEKRCVAYHTNFNSIKVRLKRFNAVEAQKHRDISIP